MANRTRNDAPAHAGQPSKAPEAAKNVAMGGRIEVLINGVRVEVSPELEAAVHRAYQGMNRSLPAEMTTTQAAEFLDVSRPFVIKLIRQRELPCRMVGKHRRIPSASLLEYREKMFQQAKNAADEMTQLSQEQGLSDLGSPPRKAR
jgi:excisionase family DNA binding protein